MTHPPQLRRWLRLSIAEGLLATPLVVIATPGMGAERSAFADGVDDLAQDLGFGDILGGGGAVKDAVVVLELLDLGSKNPFEALVDLPGILESVRVD